MTSLSSGIMIDKPDTIDRDDALWCEPAGDGWDAVVHIACFADVIPIGSSADMHAARQMRTIYLPNKVIPMLPRRIEDAATLHPEHARDSVRVSFHVDATGAVSGARAALGRLTNAVAMDYATATAAVAEENHPQHRVLRAAHHAAHALLGHRRDHGALVLYDLQRGVATDGDGALRTLTAVERHSAYLIVAEFMVAANQAVAQFAVDADLPILFRNHQPAAAAPPREQLLVELRQLLDSGESWRQDTTTQRLSHLLRPAFYASHTIEHFGLRLPWYCHATSPLRRYADLLVQRQVLAALRGQTPPYTAGRLDEFAEAINAKMREVRERRRERGEQEKLRERRDALAAGGFADLEPDEFHKVLRVAVGDGRYQENLETDLLRRVARGQVGPRDAYQVLFVATDPQWAASRDALSRWIGEHPEHAVTLVSMHVQTSSAPAPRWVEKPVGTVHEPLFSVQVGVEVGGQFTWSATRVARAKNSARQQAALSLVAALAGLPDPSSTSAVPQTVTSAPSSAGPVTGHNPIMTVNEWAQVGVLSGLTFGFDGSGPSHRPTFTCTAKARHTGSEQDLTATGTGATKAAAKTVAAQALRDQVQAIEPGQ